MAFPQAGEATSPKYERLSVAAHRVAVGSQTLRRWINQDPDLAALVRCLGPRTTLIDIEGLDAWVERKARPAGAVT